MEAIEASSNEDFDIVDVMYAVAKTYKDQYYTSVLEDDEKRKEPSKRKTKPRRKAKRSLHQFDTNDAIQDFYKIYNQKFENSSNVPFGNAQNLYEENVSYPKAESKVANLFNVPVADQFLGFLAIPTNQAVAELALKQLEWICFLFVSHIFDTNASGEE